MKISFKTGVRSWRIVFTDNIYYVRSLVINSLPPWTPGEPLKAQCHTIPSTASKHATTETPVWRCDCGIYARKETAKDYFDFYDEGRTIEVAGTVAGWGKTIEHEKGYRFEYAYPLSFDDIRASCGCDDVTLYQLDSRWGLCFACDAHPSYLDPIVTLKQQRILHSKDGILNSLRENYLQ